MRHAPPLALALLAVGLPAPAQESAPDPHAVKYADALAHKPTPLPDRIVLTWRGDPATTQAVTWRTDTTVPAAVAQVALAEDGPNLKHLRTPAGDTNIYPAASARLATDLGECLYHRVEFAGLKPGTKYVYRVGDGANWSEWLAFETASRRPEPFGFIYFGDAQNDIKSHWSRVARGAYSGMPKARFIIHAGDLVDRWDSDAQWGEWFAAAGWINGTVPNVPSPGNHEYHESSGRKVLTAHWRAQFTLPENGPPGLEETCYTFDFQGVRVVCLNSNEKQAEQVAWLERVLARNPNRWTVVTFHHPIYSPTGRDNKDLRELWRPVFDKYAVDLALTGHDHSYGRSGLMREDNLLAGGSVRDRGTVYVVSVSGPKLYGVSRQEWTRVTGQHKQLYQHVWVDGGTLRYEARTARGDLFDSFELRKRAGAGNEMVELGAPKPAPDGGGGSGPAAAVVVLAAVACGVAWAVRGARGPRR